MPAKTAATWVRTVPFHYHAPLAITRVTQPYFLSAEIASVVSFVDDNERFPIVRESMIQRLNASTSKKPDTNSCGTTCAGFPTPSGLGTAYTFSILSAANAGSSVSVAEFQGQYRKLFLAVNRLCCLVHSFVLHRGSD